MPIYNDQLLCRCAAHGREGFHSKNAPVHYPPNLELEPSHLDIDLYVQPATESAAGTVTTTVVGRVDGPRTIEFDAVDFDDVKVSDPDGNEIEFDYDGKKLRVTWTKAFAAGEERKVAVSYRVEEPVAGLYFSRPTKDYPDRERWAATDHETEKARHWLPCIDHPNVRATLDFHLRADASFTILANGARVGEDVRDDGTKVVHWKLDFPCPSYLTCFTLGEFTEATDGSFEEIPVAYYAAKHHRAADLLRSFGRTRDMLTWMTAKLDQPFPYPKYFQFALPSFGGAMENISLVSWDDIFVLDEDLAREWKWLVDQINVHEMAHSYFGDAVVCRDFSQVWLKESWATYMEQCWLEDQYGDDEYQYDFYRNAMAYFGEADNAYKRPIVTRKFDSSWDMYDRHLYPGGACRLHTLRKQVGDDNFWTGVAAYLAEHIGSVVETEDFRRAIEKSSGQALARFFDQWFYTAGYPHLGASFSFDAEKREGTFTIEQKQVGEDREGPVFELELDLAWTIDDQTTTEKVKLCEAKHYFTFAMKSDPEMVRIDPRGKVLHKQEFNPGDQKLRKQLTDGPTILDRIRAAHELSKTRKRKNLSAIADAYADEPFWGVRQQFASALADAGTAFALDALRGFVATEKDAMVLDHLMRSVASFRDDGLAEAVRNRLETGDLAPWATQFAWATLGNQRDPGALPMFAEAAGKATFHDISRLGAIRALAATRSTAAAEKLFGVAGAGQAETRARATAARAIGELGAFLEKRDREAAREFLEDLLRDDVLTVAKAAAAGLAEMGAVASIGRIEALRERLAHQESVAIGRIVEGLRKGEKDKVANLEKQLEDLRSDFRKLTERVEKMDAD